MNILKRPAGKARLLRPSLRMGCKNVSMAAIPVKSQRDDLGETMHCQIQKQVLSLENE